MSSSSQRDALRAALAHPLDHTDFDVLGKKYEGKVRDNYTTADGRRYLVTTDRISAFDRVLGTLPLKGQILNAAARYWFEETKHLAPNQKKCRSASPRIWRRVAPKTRKRKRHTSQATRHTHLPPSPLRPPPHPPHLPPRPSQLAKQTHPLSTPSPS